MEKKVSRNRLKVRYISLAFKNIGRHKIKTIITVLAISIGIAAYLFLDAWLMGMNLDSRRNLVCYETGAARIYSKEYLKNKDDLPLYDGFSNFQPIIKTLNEQGYAAAPEAVFTGSLLSRNQEFPFKFIGIDPTLNPTVFRYDQHLENDGSRFIRKGKFEINLGIKGAQDLNVGIPVEMELSDFNNNILSNIDNQNDVELVLKSYDMQLIPPDIEADVFKRVILKKIKNKEDIDTIKRFYKKPFGSKLYNLKEKITPNEISKINTILDSINFTYEKKYVLKDKLSEDEKVNLWRIMTEAGINTVRISTVIDKKDEKGNLKHINQLIELIVVGEINSPNPTTNGYVGYIPLDILQGDIGMMLEGSITDISIRKSNADDSTLPGKFESPDTIKKKLNGTLPDNLTIVDWKEDAKDYLAVSNGDNLYNRLIIIFFIFITLVGIANTMLMSVLERTKEIGMLRALGMTDSSIVRLFLTEAAMIGFIGTLIGISLGILINIYMVNHGIDYTKMIERTGLNNFGYRVVGIYKSAWNFLSMVGSMIVGTLACSATALLPALRALKMSIVDAMRFE